MNAAAEKIHKKIKAHVEGLGIYSPIDEIELTRLAVAMEVNSRAFKEVSKLDFTKPDKAYTQSSTYVTWKESTNIIKELSDKFGLTPLGRKRLSIQAKKEDKDPLAAFVS